jgi:uncharacterized protein YndB with AHSA1/START domain
MSTTDATTLRLERTFHAPAQAVFDAWTNPEVLRRWWMVNPTWNPSVAEVDLRVGGSYRLAMQDPDADAPHTVQGRYLEVRPPELLVYTWAWEDGDGQLGPESTVTVKFLAGEQRTTVTLEHSGLSSPDSRDKHGQGWMGCMSCLEALLEQLAPQST